jgi:hypothetical protein
MDNNQKSDSAVDAATQNLELVIARLEQIIDTEGQYADNLVDLAKDALPCALSIRAARQVPAADSPPIDMILHCPACHLQHIDAPDERTPDWKNAPHRSHLCHGCGHIWRPADVPTNGVQAIATKGKADSPAAVPQSIAAPEGAAKDAARYRWLRDKSEPGICAFYLSVGQAFHQVKFKPETVDDAIDAQIAATPAKGETQ